jgi:hypothetical protein
MRDEVERSDDRGCDHAQQVKESEAGKAHGELRKWVCDPTRC